MLIYKAYKFKLKLNSKNKEWFAKNAGCARLVWNKALALQISNCEYIQQQFAKLGGRAMDEKQAKKLKKALYQTYFPTAFDIMGKVLTAIWKKSEELSFLKDCVADSLRKPIADLDKAFFKAFTKKGGFPKFKKKGNRDSVHFSAGFKIKDNKVFLPKLGWVKFFKSREIEGIVKNVTVTSDRLGNWFASFCTEEEKTIEKRIEGEIGINLGVRNFAGLSNGELIQKPKSIKILLAKKKKAQKALARKKKGGNNRKKAVLVLRKIETKIANIRKDFLHKTSTNLSKNHAMIVAEDFNIVKMTKSAKGTKENPGVNVKVKSIFNREILANGWGDFKTMLKYKQEYSGGIFLTVSPVNNSRICSLCKEIDKDSRISIEEYCCTSCGYKTHADTNAAVNVLAAGRVVLACGNINNISCLAQES